MEPSPGPSSGPAFGKAEEEEAERLVRLAIAEDLPAGDVTSAALIPASARVRGTFVPRGRGVACGIPVAVKVFSRLDARIECRPLLRDGEAVEAGKPLLEVEGPARGVLAGERAALNFLQRLSGIATRTRRWVEILSGTGATLLDTRKTAPGWRRLEKYAVRAGGGHNHRLSLSDQALVKDNHIRILRKLGKGGPRAWVAAIRKQNPGIQVELEVESLEEFREAMEAVPDIILLDNMPAPEMARAAREAREAGRAGNLRRPLLEASGGIEEGRLLEVAACGVDRISAGALTHSAAALDIGFDLAEVSIDENG